MTTTDLLGSPRVVTDTCGQVLSRRDFLPFGEDVNVGIGGRTGDGGQSYSSSTDKVRQKFTGYQKDTETSLDFAEARMYENRYGRFTAVDPLLASGKSADPQTFNRYAYTSNNPVVRVDSNGKDWYYHRELKVNRHGRSFYHTVIYWVNDGINLAGRDRYSGTGIVYETKGDRKGLYTALDPYEGRSESFENRGDAVAQYQSYLKDRNINATRGFADALASSATGNPITELLYKWGADALIGPPNEDSNVYTISNRTTNAMIVVATATGGGAAIVSMRGARLSETAIQVAATGQRHHLLTTKIMRALNKHDTLSGIFSRQDAKFIYNAVDEAAHKGYQSWHRRYDNEATSWLKNNKDATEEQFIKFLDKLHQQSWLRERMPSVNLRGN